MRVRIMAMSPEDSLATRSIGDFAPRSVGEKRMKLGQAPTEIGRASMRRLRTSTGMTREAARSETYISEASELMMAKAGAEPRSMESPIS